MSEQEKKRQRISDLLNAEKFLCLFRENFFYKKKSNFRKRNGGLNKKRKEGFLTAFTTAIKKEPTTSIRKHANELRVYEKRGRQLNKI